MSLQQTLDVARKLTKNGKVYGHVRGTNIYLLRWIVTAAQRDYIIEMRLAAV